MLPDRSTVDVFLCHTGANKDWTRKLAERLESERLGNRHIRVFFDEWDVAHGENVLERLEHGLREARYFAIVLSPALTRAAWPTMEWQTQVHDDPSGRQARILPLLLEKFDPDTLEPLDIPLPLRLLRYFDFTDERRVPREYEQLVARIRDERPQRGRRTLGEVVSAIGVLTGPETADPIEEVLLGNLFPVVRIPSQVHSDITVATGYPEVWDALPGQSRVPFVLHGARLYSFVHPNADANPLRRFLTGADPRSDEAQSWLADPALSRQFIWLCNDALRERCYALNVRCPRGERHQFYPVCTDGKPRHFSWGSGRPITLAKVAQRAGRQLGVHHSARMRFVLLGDRLNLLIEPGWFFTLDGITPLEGRQVGIYSVRWGGREGNDTVLRHTLMWARLLAAGSKVIELAAGGGSLITVAPLPIYGRANLGIYEDETGLSKILSGEGAGEVGAGLADEELDQVAAARDREPVVQDEFAGADREGEDTQGAEEPPEQPELAL